MDDIGLLYNPRVAASLPLAEEIADWLQERGVDAWICSTRSDDVLSGCPLHTDLLLTLGGDGTILRAMHLATPHGVPVLGLNLGRVGFLTECNPGNWERTLRGILAGEGRIELRTLLQATLVREEVPVAEDFALNDAVISRGALARTVRLETSIDDTPVVVYVGDGLILATATGSTAYSYALGGPILPPWLDNMLVVPAAAHLSMDRPMVLNAEAVVEVTVHTREPGMLTVDGQLTGELHDGDRVRVQRSSLQARFLRLRSRNDFYRSLVERLTPRNGVDR
jgi:NAD+ kinase